ncbi:MAG: cytochrome c [Myxococcota bacterium]
MRTWILAALLPVVLSAALLGCTGPSDKDDTGAAADTDTDTDSDTDTDTDLGPDGAALYSANCSSCHGDSAEGTRSAPPLEGEMRLSDTQLVGIIRNGKEEMPAVDVTEEEALAIVGWLRALFGA